MVVAIFCHIFLMLIDRYMYLTITSESAQQSPSEGGVTELKKTRLMTGMKLILHLVLSIFIHFLVFWGYPMAGNLAISGSISCAETHRVTDSDTCNNFQVNAALQWFYVLYLAYLIISAQQLKLGVPSFCTGGFPLTQHYSLWSKWLFQAYLQVPFLFELRTLTDWVCAKTALDFWQWLKIEDNYARLYIAKVNQSYYLERELGTPINWWYKFWIGICGSFAVLSLLLIPLFLFSSLNFLAHENPVKTMSVEFGILVDSVNYYKIYTANRVSDLHYLTSTEWTSLNFTNLRDIEDFEKAHIQVLTIPMSSDSIWVLSPEVRVQLVKALYSNDTKIEVMMSCSYTRDKTTTSSHKKSIENAILRSQLKGVSSYTFTCPHFFYSLWRIPSAGERLEPFMLTRNAEQFQTDLQFTLSETKGEFPYWRMGVPSKSSTTELRFYVLSEKFSPATLNFGIVTFYLTVVFFVGKTLRQYTGGGADNFILTEMRRPDVLLDMSDAIYLARMAVDLEKEETLFYELIDILRSPETLKMVTERSSVRHWTKAKSD